MTYGICKLSAIALRKENRHTSEMVSQLLYNETYTILDKRPEWILVQTHFDHYEGWIQAKQFAEIGQCTLIGTRCKQDGLEHPVEKDARNGKNQHFD